MISYQVFGKKTSLIKSSTGRIVEKETESGGNLLELGSFAEYKAAAFLIGGSISYSMMDPTETVDSLEIIHNDPRRFLSTKIYGRKVVAEDLSLIPSLHYRTLRSKNIDNLEYSNSSDLALQVNIELAI
jgi:hypothetical protein